MTQHAGDYPPVRSIPNSPLDGMLVHRRVIPSIKLAGTHLYTWVERGTVRVKCFAQEHNTMSPARSRAHQPWGHRASHKTKYFEQDLIQRRFDVEIFQNQICVVSALAQNIRELKHARFCDANGNQKRTFKRARTVVSPRFLY